MFSSGNTSFIFAFSLEFTFRIAIFSSNSPLAYVMNFTFFATFSIMP
jgi:hypothetical protein